MRDGYIKSNPVAGVTSPKLEKRLPIFLDVNKVTKLVESPDKISLLGLRDRAILETLYSTGMRVSELVGLNIGRVDFIGGMVKVYGKGKKERLIPIGDRALRAIRDYLGREPSDKKENRAMFLNKSRRRLTISRQRSNILERIKYYTNGRC